ncbi:MAG: anhydro-N-acetylmuramic acid kinase, partial [Gemmatimonadota bacterium]
MELLYLGLMSGTSLDGIDAALVRLDQSSPSMDASLEAFRTIPFSRDQRASIEAALAGGSQPAASVRELARLNRKLGEWFADAALELLNDAGVESESVAAVGSHGQTIWHEPPAKGGRSPGSTLQLGEAAVIAERLGVPVVSDFRARDVAAGGQGAPLVPLVDRVLFSSPDRHR